jgi:threonyl-tRNA synthetase
MKELASKDYVYERQSWPRQEAIDFFTKRGEPLKVQLIEEKTAGQPEVSVYTIKDKDTFLDSASARTCRRRDASRRSS